MDRAEHSLDTRGAFGEPEVVDALHDMAVGLAELHAAGVLHRDLSPRNVLRHHGRWKLADFGLARDVDVSTATVTWAQHGTLPYIAPERLEPPGVATVKSDLYSLGCIAYELVTGGPPFSSQDPAELIRQHLQDAPDPLPSGVNVTLARLIMRLLRKDQPERPQDARSIVEWVNRVSPHGASTEVGTLLQALAAEHDQEIAGAEAQRRALEDARRRRRDRIVQARSDLDEIVSAGCDQIQQQLPDVELRRVAEAFEIVGEHASLTVHMWPDDDVVQRDNSVVALGHISGTNRRMRDLPPLANIACEVNEETGFTWVYYQYQRGAFSGAGGPVSLPDGRFGFLKRDFLNDQVYPFAFKGWHGLHIFSKAANAPLTPEVIVQLYEDAMGR